LKRIFLGIRLREADCCFQASWKFHVLWISWHEKWDNVIEYSGWYGMCILIVE
jgi:hypothetical protein